ncbi:MAG: Crp/Fnr family transcriptional regulator [Oxalobacteraceae bacterium]|nr:MAG: Crp/Fnr family transcriptional regulator [Oxalobacteraceae bacterium]
MQGANIDGAVIDNPATARLNVFGSLEETELAGLIKLAGPERTMTCGEILWEEGRLLPTLFVLVDGWMSSRRIVGSTREITTKLHLAGDVLGFPSLAFATATETSVALTHVKLRPLALHSLGHLFEAHPRVAAMMFLVSQQERVDLLDQLALAYTADPTQRLAAFVCRLLQRVKRSYPETTDSFFLPVTRRHVADIIGATLPQLAEALKQLRAEDIMGWTDRLLTIVDSEALVARAGLPTRRLARDVHWLPAITGDAET